MKSFNTASGMDCMQLINIQRMILDDQFQYRKRYGLHAIQRRFSPLISGLKFQYRKRYGLHAIQIDWKCPLERHEFQYRKRYGLHAIMTVHCTNTHTFEFQYRKRYGLHAILSPGSLGNSEPKNRVSNDDPLFAFFPKVSGTFLSRKVLRKGLEASHSKGTFVHERNLILMAFSLDFRASLEQSIS